jgi:hypothetical protein
VIVEFDSGIVCGRLQDSFMGCEMIELIFRTTRFERMPE